MLAPKPLAWLTILVAVHNFAAISGATDVEWSYLGDAGVNYWPSLFALWCNGTQQSPIDLKSATAAALADPAPFAGNLTTFDLILPEVAFNNYGGEVEIDLVSYKLLISGGGLTDLYVMKKLMLHWGHNSSHGSEHSIDGVYYPLEMQLIGYSTKFMDFTSASASLAKGSVAEFSIMAQLSATGHVFFDKLVDRVPLIVEAGETTVSNLPIGSIVHEIFSSSHFYRYNGSSTVPSCEENTVWTVFSSALNITEDQLRSFRTLKDHSESLVVDNFRPVQKLNGRRVEAGFRISQNIPSHSWSVTAAKAGHILLLISVAQLLS